MIGKAFSLGDERCDAEDNSGGKQITFPIPPPPLQQRNGQSNQRQRAHRRRGGHRHQLEERKTPEALVERHLHAQEVPERAKRMFGDQKRADDCKRNQKAQQRVKRRPQYWLALPFQPHRGQHQEEQEKRQGRRLDGCRHAGAQAKSKDGPLAAAAAKEFKEEGIRAQEQHRDDEVPLARLPCSISAVEQRKSVAPKTPASQS